MNEIFVARNEFAATLTSSAVAKSVTTTGVPVSRTGAKAARICCSAHSVCTPNTIRSGRRVSSTAKPSRRNSGFQASSTSLLGARLSRSSSRRAAVPGRHRRLADDQHLAGQVRRQRAERRVDVGHVGGEFALALRGAHADEVHVGELGDLGVGRGEAQLAAVDVLGQQFGQAGLVERDLACPQPLDLRLVDVQADDLVAELDHADRVGGPEVPRPDDGQARPVASHFTIPSLLCGWTLQRLSGPTDATSSCGGGRRSGRVGHMGLANSTRLTARPAWLALSEHHARSGDTHLRELFAADPERGERLTLEAEGIYLDYSKNRITDETMELLVRLAEESGLRARIDAMFAGEKINVTEDRAVLHTALRAQGRTDRGRRHRRRPRGARGARPDGRVRRPGAPGTLARAHRQADPQHRQRRHRRLRPRAR